MWREAAPGLVTTWVCFQLDAPGRHSWEKLSLMGVSTEYRQTVGNEGDTQFCSLAALSLPVDAGIEQKTALRVLLFLAVCIPN